eukprot:353934-Chlamydomonas_euryale.AAC.4
MHPWPPRCLCWRRGQSNRYDSGASLHTCATLYLSAAPRTALSLFSAPGPSPSLLPNGAEQTRLPKTP